jgi:hypothetical protein
MRVRINTLNSLQNHNIIKKSCVPMRLVAVWESNPRGRQGNGKGCRSGAA